MNVYVYNCRTNMLGVLSTSFRLNVLACKCTEIYAKHSGVKRSQDEQNTARKAPKKRKTNSKGAVIYCMLYIKFCSSSLFTFLSILVGQLQGLTMLDCIFSSKGLFFYPFQKQTFTCRLLYFFTDCTKIRMQHLMQARSAKK